MFPVISIQYPYTPRHKLQVKEGAKYGTRVGERGGSTFSSTSEIGVYGRTVGFSSFGPLNCVKIHELTINPSVPFGSGNSKVNNFVL